VSKGERWGDPKVAKPHAKRKLNARGVIFLGGGNNPVKKSRIQKASREARGH